MKRAISVILLLVILGGSIAYVVRNRESGATKSETTPDIAASAGGPAPVTISTARRRPMRRTIVAVGVLRAERVATVTAKTPARITSVLVRAGDRVRSGQLLFQLDTRDLSAQISGASAGVEAARALSRKAAEGKLARAIEMDSLVAQARGGLDTALAKRRQAELSVILTGASAQSDSDRAVSAVRQAEAGLRLAEVGLAQAAETAKRLRFLYSRGGVPRVDLEGAEAQEQIAMSQRDSASAALDEARAAAKPAASAIPLRQQVSNADLEAARAGVIQAEAGLKNAIRARGQALRVADQDIAAALAQVNQARSVQTQATWQMSGSELVSTFAGVVTEVLAHAGELAQPGQPLATVASPESIRFEASAPVRYAPQIRPGQEARITLDASPGRAFNGTVSRILPASAQDGRSFPIEIRVPGAGTLMPGSQGRADIDLTADENAIAIPVDALRNEGSVNFVYVVENGVAVRRNPTFGAVEGAYVQVLSGVRLGDQVIIAGPASLQSGTSVKVVSKQ